MLKRALTELSGYMDVYFRAHVLSTREVYGENAQTEKGKERCMYRGVKKTFPHVVKSQGKRVSHLWLGSHCAAGNRNARR